MNILTTFKGYCKNPYRVFVSLSNHGMLNWMSDKAYLRVVFHGEMGKRLNLSNPQTYNEKLQWLKLYDRNPDYVKLVDKYRVREYIKNTIGEEYLIPLLGVWERAEEIDFDKLPNQFVLKCNHDSGSIIVCRDKSRFDVAGAISKLNKCLKIGTYSFGREWPYKDVKPCIIAEKYMEDADTQELRDYKFFAFDGEIRAVFIASDRQNENKPTAFDFFDMEFNHLNIINGHPMADKTIEKPKNFDEMRQLSSKLSKGIPHVRVDFYEVNGKTYFGEMTFYHHSGFTPFEPEEWDYTFGSWITLPKIDSNRSVR